MITTITHFDRILSAYPDLIVAAVVVLVLVSALSGRRFNGKLLVVYLGGIIYLTVLNRGWGGRRYLLTPLWSYRRFGEEYFRRQILYNIGLFVPLGTVYAQLAPRWKTVRWLVITSVAIELLQYITGRGFLETDDIISNTLGGLAGFVVGMFFVKLKELIDAKFA